MKKMYFWALFFSLPLFSQVKINQNEGQVWLGYMTSVKLNKDFSLWNDFHWASDNFFVARHGITYHLSKQVALTGGYAWGYLSTASSDKLTRNEHRPWAQIMFTSNLGEGWQTQQRVRYDARFREKIVNGEVVDGEYGFNHRLRYMFNIRKTLDGKPFNSQSTFLSLNNEILVNLGKEITKNNLDQFRASLLLGKTYDNMTFQLGYMYRFVPQSAANTYKHYHGLTLWINHNFKTKKGTDELIRDK